MSEINQEKINTYLENIRKKYSITENAYNILIDNYIFKFTFLKSKSSLSFIEIKNGIGTTSKQVYNNEKAFNFFYNNINIINHKLSKIVK